MSAGSGPGTTAGREPSAGARRAGELGGRRRRVAPTLELEAACRPPGGLVAGIDEVGRGAWAGPLTVGVAVVAGGAAVPHGLADSKLLTEPVREAMFDPLGTWCASWAVGHASPAECDALGMTAALAVACGRALESLAPAWWPAALILDGVLDYASPALATLAESLPGCCPMPVVRTVVRGDRTCASVAAASVLAKVTRDRIMRQDAAHFPAFDFDRNKGYPSPVHRRALDGYGPTAIHRRSWSYVAGLPWPGTGSGAAAGAGAEGG